MPPLDELARAALSEELWKAECTSTPVAPLTERYPGLGQDDSYGIQAGVASIREDLGHRVVGKKVGLTSPAMQEMAGVREPDFGQLFDVMEAADGDDLELDSLIAPKVEPEIAFVLGKRLEGPLVTPRQVLAAIDFVAPALEIVDSRIADWRIRWHDTVADNGSSARFVLGDRAFSPRGVDFEALPVVVERNGRAAANGCMRDVLGSPLRSVCWLVHKLATHGIALEAGDVVLPGSPCRAVDAGDGDVFRADFGALGSVALGFVRRGAQQTEERKPQ
ncbi:2-keto-4-pentenoate hydratase [Pseudonocardia sp. H11422]|uniref:2-keto-4-pentenoate hydratase n=1 Tax=Pseudonocardia sp. H11422 TaxID=2835866 RepID=UPI001BDC2571|nr:fumarylacetoacetate hydrolase family protein [Pseudonocardia sp. H11422]